MTSSMSFGAQLNPVRANMVKSPEEYQWGAATAALLLWVFFLLRIVPQV